METKDYKRVYVWQMPVRVFHWANAGSIVVLSATGLLIAHPPALMSSAEASNQFLFGWIRYIHFVAAYIFVAAMGLRIYWAFVGNKFAKWKAFLPFSKQARSNMMHVLKHDIFLLPEKNPKLKDVSVGHNAMAASAYIAMFFLALMMVFTGFGLYSDMSTWWFPQMFAWVPGFMGGDFAARTLHHVVMWGIWFIIIIHIYLVLFHDWLEGRGETSAMLSGFKFVRKERVNDEIES